MSTTGEVGPTDDRGTAAPAGGPLPPPYPAAAAETQPAGPAPTWPAAAAPTTPAGPAPTWPAAAAPTTPAGPAPQSMPGGGWPAPDAAAEAAGWQAPDPATRYPAHGAARRPGRRRRRGLAALGVTMMVLAGAGILAIVAGLGLRTWELGRLLDEIEQSEAVMIDAQEEVRSIAEGALGEESADRAEAEESLQRIAAESGEELAQIAEEIAVLRIAPWNASIEQARTSYLAHSQAWQDFLGAASEDAEQWFETYPDIDRTWNVFVTDVGLAVPSIDAVGLGDRVDAVVGDTPGGGGGAEGTLDV